MGLFNLVVSLGLMYNIGLWIALCFFFASSSSELVYFRGMEFGI